MGSNSEAGTSVTITKTRHLLEEGQSLVNTGVRHDSLCAPSIHAQLPDIECETLYNCMGVVVVGGETDDYHDSVQERRRRPQAELDLENSFVLPLTDSHDLSILGEKICPDIDLNHEPVVLTTASSAGGALILCLDVRKEAMFLDQTGKILSELHFPKSSKSLHDLACFGNDVFITDRKSGCLHVFTRHGSYRHKIKLGFKDPAGISINFPDVFITSAQTNRVYTLRINKDHRDHKVVGDSCSKFATDAGATLYMREPLYIATNVSRVAV